MESNRGIFRYIRELFSCRRFSEVASLDLDRELTASESFLLRFHALYCFMCRRFRRQVAKIDAHAKAVIHWCEHGDHGEGLSSERKEAIQRALESHPSLH